MKAGANHDRMRLYIRVVGRYQEATGGPVITAIKAGNRQQSDRPRRLQDRAKTQPAAAGRRLLGVGGRFLKKRIGTSPTVESEWSMGNLLAVWCP